MSCFLLIMQTLGALSTDQSVFPYSLPNAINSTANISVEFSILGTGTQV